MAKTKVLGQSWNFASAWNDALKCMPERPMQKREHIWASELGLSYVDRYLRMHAHPMTNPPNERSRRKFIAGHFWEWIISFVLTIIGVLRQKQLRGEVELPGLLRVTGKLDFIAGGLIDWQKAHEEIKRLQSLFAYAVGDMPPFVLYAVEFILVKMEKQYGKHPMKEIIFENKAISTYMMEKIQRSEKPIPHNVLQSYHYILANKELDEAKINYICKDDSIMQEFTIENSRGITKLYREDVEKMTEYFRASNHKKPLKTLPPKEPLVLFDPILFRFEKNFKIEYSNYLELLYRYKTPEEYRDRWVKSVSGWNAAFKRCVLGKK
jgi:hypothetical protein